MEVTIRYPRQWDELLSIDLFSEMISSRPNNRPYCFSWESTAYRYDNRKVVEQDEDKVITLSLHSGPVNYWAELRIEERGVITWQSQPMYKLPPLLSGFIGVIKLEAVEYPLVFKKTEK